MIPCKQLTVSLWFFVTLPAMSQQALPAALTTRLDSITMCSGKERHFGELYLQTTWLADLYIEALPGEGRILMKRLEESFAVYFFKAIEANNNNEEVPAVWKNYFHGNYSSLQLKLVGANAHINGDIWQALADNFSIEEIKHLRPFYKNYNRSIVKTFDELYASAIRSDKRLRDLHVITFGLDKVYGRILLRKWRNRQLRLAILKSENPKRFNALKKRIGKKRGRIDKVISRRLHVKE